MSSLFCNVALAVPLRTTFTYAVPEAFRATVHPGSRVLVPFRKKAMVGVVVELVESPPPGTKIREITSVLDFVPALTPKLIELAQWIAGYYLAPVGEVFRAMLPPAVDLKSQRQIILTDEGREAAESLSGGELSHGLTGAEVELLTKLKKKNGPLAFGPAARLGVDAAGLQKLQRRGLIEIRESITHRHLENVRCIFFAQRKRRTHSWTSGSGARTVAFAATFKAYKSDSLADRADAARRTAGKLGRADRSGGRSV
jgi:primosomal protein N'